MALNTFRLVSGEMVTTGLQRVYPSVPDAFANDMIPAIEDQVLVYLNRPLVYEADRVEWFNPSNEAYLLLSLTPVQSVSEVRYDPLGGYGAIADSFGDDTVLTAGDDYYLQKDSTDPLFPGWSKVGLLWRRDSTWGFRRQWSGRLLGSAEVAARGTVKVTYSGGYTLGTNLPGAISLAVVRILSTLWQIIHLTGPKNSEMIGGYSYSLANGIAWQSPEFFEIAKTIDPWRRRIPNAGSVTG